MAPDQTAFRRREFTLKEGRMAAIALGDPARAPDLLFLHATGLNAMTYRAMLAPLSARYHVVAVDLRGHGRSDLPARRWGYRSWNRHRDDVIELLETHFHGAVTLAGHSMGATTSLLVAGSRPELVRSLCLIEPVILKPTLERGPNRGGQLARGARRRRVHFPSKPAVVAALAGRGFFATFPDEALADYAEDGFQDDPNGGVRLACSPAYEAATFKAQGHDVWRAFAAVTAPLVLLRADQGSTCPEHAAMRIAAARPDARIAVVEGSTHALPIERPDRARAALETALVIAEGQARFHDLD